MSSSNLMSLQAAAKKYKVTEVSLRRMLSRNNQIATEGENGELHIQAGDLAEHFQKDPPTKHREPPAWLQKLEQLCDRCGDRPYPECRFCNGTGRLLTEEGEDAVAFLKRHWNMVSVP